MREKIHIRAEWSPIRQRMFYYYGLHDIDFIGSSWTDKKGNFIKSESLKDFLNRGLVGKPATNK